MFEQKSGSALTKSETKSLCIFLWVKTLRSREKRLIPERNM